ncbi:MAG TPA: tetratricopeptide repeat protein [Planctomycetota bacterium]|nr:tetratricopeptide repeat protein [Planctomycetota bacterium]
MSDTSPPAGDAASEAPEARSGPGPAWTIVAPLFLALLSIGLHLPTLNYKLVYDDAFLIGNSALMAPVVSHFGAAFAFFGNEYWEGVNPDHPEALRIKGQALYRPLTLFAWACCVAATGGATVTWPLHLLSILVNAVVVVLLYQLLRRLFRSTRVAFAAALLFALHPLHSEAVAYVAGLSDVLSAAAVLLGLLLWERATRTPGRVHMGAFVGLMATLFIGLMAKEQTAVLPAAVALTDLTFALRGENRRGWPRTAVYFGFLLILGVHVMVRYAAIGNLRPSSMAISRLDNPLINEPFGFRLINGVKILAMQVWLFLWPAKLSVDYSFNALPMSKSWLQPEALAAGVLIALLLVYGLVMLKRRPALGWGVCLFLGTALFTSNILLPIGTIFGERLMYLSSAGLCLAVAVLLDVVLRDRRLGASPWSVAPVGLLALFAFGALLCVRTWEHNRDFATSQALFEAAEEVVPESARVQYQLGTLMGNQQLYTAAEEHFTRSLAIDPTMIQSAIGLGDVYTASNNWDKAIDVYNRILKQLSSNNPEDPAVFDEVTRMVYTRRAGAKAGKGDLDGSAADLRSAMQVTGGTEQRVGPHLQLARLLMDRGKVAEAIPVLKQALALQPGHVEALFLLARCSTLVQDEEAYEQALSGLEQTETGRPLALAARAEVAFAQADAANDEPKRLAALQDFEQLRDQLPTLPTPYVYRGRYFVEKERFLDAIIELDRALERAPRLPAALLWKAVAQNGAGRPKDALETEKQLELILPDAACYTAMFRSNFLLGDLPEMEKAAAKLKELGVEPTDTVQDLAKALRDAGRVDDAIAAVESGLLLSGSQNDPGLLFSLGVLLVDAGRYDEALGVFDRQEAAEQAIPGHVVDPFLPINRARCYMALDRDVEAAAQLEVFEQSVQPDSTSWLSLAHRRSELFLKRTSPFYNPAGAVELTEHGLTVAKGLRIAHPQLLLCSIEALAATKDYAGALARAKEALASFPADVTFQVAARAMQFATDGNVPGAIEALRKPNDKDLNRVAAQLEG